MLDRFDWEEIPAASARATAARIFGERGHEVLMDIGLRGHAARLPFYTDVRLHHLAFLRDDEPAGTLLLLVHGDEAVVLTGRSNPVHDLNRTVGLELDEATAPDYLRFFCFVVRGEEGPFHVLEPTREIVIEPPMPEIVPEVAKHAREVEAVGRDESGRLLYRAVVAYGGSLFNTKFAVQTDGQIEMIEDEVIEDDAIDEIPVWPPLIDPELAKAASGAPARVGPVGGAVLRTLVELLLEHALETESGHRLLAHFNRTLSDRTAIDQFAGMVTTTSPVVLIESSIPFVEEIVVEIIHERLPVGTELPTFRAETDVHDDTRLRPTVPARGPGLLSLSFHSYRSVADVERVSHELTSRDVAALVGCEQVRDVPEPLRRIADLSLTLPPLTPALFQTLFVRVMGQPMPTDWQEGGAHWVRHVLHSDLEQPQSLALAAADALAFMRERVEARMREVDPADSLSLQDLHGLGEAREFAEDLIADIHDAIAGRIEWSDVDRGVLLAGPPGTGKTTLARAIARDCRVKFVRASAATWQAAGHLGDHIRAMRSDFAQARRHAPAILFIDEIDSIGSREQFSGQNAQYHTEVVNALLEQMQGLDPSAPVIVIAATNHADRVDPALRRAGRLDRVIEIPYPSKDGLAGIFEHYLSRYRSSGAVGPDVDAKTLGALSLGMTGADVERIVRGAARRARKSRRPMGQRDLLEEVLGIPRERDSVARLTPEEIVRVAAHEAGHAMAACLSSTKGREVSYVSIVPRADGSLGFVARVPSSRRVITRTEIIERIEVTMAGRAAEEILFGDNAISTGAGGPSSSSDLAVATATALQLVAQTGLSPDGNLLWSSQPNARHLEQAEQILRDAYIAVRSRLTAHRAGLERIANELHRTQELTGEQVRRLAAAEEAPLELVDRADGSAA